MTTPQQNSSTNNKLFIVAIGASAGSLDFINELVQSLPTKATNVALILAQHRSAEYTTEIHRLIKAPQPWSLTVMEDNLEPRAGHIYINPSGYDVWMKDGILRLKTNTGTTTSTPSIDRLFRSLAKEIGNRSFGIILSGTGNDGTLGAKSIKRNNGYVIVQDPDEAKFSAMPLSVINEGHADNVLPASLIFAEVENYIKNALILSQPHSQTDRFKDILNMLSHRFGTDFGAYKASTIKRRLVKRIDHLDLADNDAYYDYLQTHPTEIGQLFETMLIGVTEFFRDAEAFKILPQYIARIIEEKAHGDPIRMWSVGCSTGEEPYSLVILLYELLGENVNKHPIQIFATDIDQRAIAIARKGIYTKESLKQVPEDLLSKYFYKNNGSYELKKTIRQHVLFSKHDITTDPPFVKLDLLTCRNLLIYFDNNLQREVIPIFHYALNPHGFLFLGKSENISNMGDLFTPLESKSRIFQKNSNAEINTLSFSSFRRKPRGEKSVEVFPELNLEEIVTETIVKTFEHPYVVVGEDMHTLLIKGSLQPYLELSEGSLNSNILKILNPAIHAELRTCFNKVRRNKEAFESNLINFSLRGQKQYLKLHIKPLVYTNGGRQNYMVIFKKIEEDERFDIPNEHLNQDDASNIIRIIELEQELEATREHLKVFTEELEVGNEELQAVNEELQSANEELKSSNEELETSNEELQSANEELQIANNELAMSHQMMIAKERQLIALKDELEVTKDRFETALANSNIFIAYQDKNLKYYWAYNTSPEFRAEGIIGKNDSELLGETGLELVDMKQEALLSSKEIRREIFANGDYWDVLCTPIFKDNEVAGLKTVASNITIRSKALRESRRSFNIVDALLKDLDDMLLVIDNDWNIIAINRSQQLQFERRFGKIISKKDNFRTALKDNPEEFERASKLIKPILSGKKISLDKVRVEENAFSNASFYYSVQGFPLIDNQGKIEGGVIISSDISDAVRAEEQVQHIIRNTTNLTNNDFFHSITDQLYNLFKAKHIFFAEIDKQNDKAKVLSYKKDGQRSTPFKFKIDGTPTQVIFEENELQVLNEVSEKFPRDITLAKWKAMGYIGIPVNSPTSGEFLGVLVMAHTEPIHQLPNSDYFFKIIAMRAGAEIETNKNIRALKNREKQLKNITSNLPEMIYEYVSTEFIEADHFTFVSNAVSQIYEVDPADLLSDSQLAWDCIYEDDLESFVIAMEKASNDLSTLNWTGRIVGRKTYQLRWVKITAKPEQMEANAVKWYGIISDISRMKMMEKALEHSRDQAEKLAAAKEDFLAIMSHEIRTPLNGIMGITALMLDEAAEGEKEYLNILKFSADNLMSLVNNILDFSKINAGKVDVLESKISLPILLKNLELSHDFKARENNNKLVFEIDKNLPIEIYGDEMIITQVLNNLLSNANKFTKAGTVKLSAVKKQETRKDVSVKFVISDTGVGISEKDIHKIFQKFKQLGDKDQRTGGTGLGLVIVKKLIEVLNSELSIESKLGEGSTFSFVLKLKKASPTRKTITKNSKNVSDQGVSHRILVADDIADNRDLISKYLSRLENFEVDFATDGNQVINMFAQKNYDLVIMDLDMPNMSGHDAAAKLRDREDKKFNDIPIIALTAESINIENNTNFNGLISKPVSYNDLRGILEKFLIDV